MEGRPKDAWVAAKRGFVPLVEEYLNNDPRQITSWDFNEQSVLHIAASNGRCAVADLLVNEFEVDVESRNGQGMTPLHCAAERGQMSMVRFLVAEGANKKARDNRRRTPMNVAEESLQVNVCRELKKQVMQDHIDGHNSCMRSCMNAYQQHKRNSEESGKRTAARQIADIKAMRRAQIEEEESKAALLAAQKRARQQR